MRQAFSLANEEAHSLWTKQLAKPQVMREAFSLANEEADSLLPHFPKGSSLTIFIKINKNKTQYMEDLPEILESTQISAFVWKVY